MKIGNELDAESDDCTSLVVQRLSLCSSAQCHCLFSYINGVTYIQKSHSIVTHTTQHLTLHTINWEEYTPRARYRLLQIVICYIYKTVLYLHRPSIR